MYCNFCLNVIKYYLFVSGDICARYCEVRMSILNIVLIEPQIPQNTGNIARTCAVTGAALHLVQPMGFTVTDRQLKRAGLDYWHSLDITYYNSTADFFAAHSDETFFFFTTKGGKCYADASYPRGAWLIFGREDKGLDEALLSGNYDRCVRIPMRDTLRSLNLSNSVAIAAYEALRQMGFPALSSKGALTT